MNILKGPDDYLGSLFMESKEKKVVWVILYFNQYRYMRLYNHFSTVHMHLILIICILDYAEV